MSSRAGARLKNSLAPGARTWIAVIVPFSHADSDGAGDGDRRRRAGDGQRHDDDGDTRGGQVDRGLEQVRMHLARVAGKKRRSQPASSMTRASPFDMLSSDDLWDRYGG